MQSSTSGLGGWVWGGRDGLCACIEAMELNLALVLSYCSWTQMSVFSFFSVFNIT